MWRFALPGQERDVLLLFAGRALRMFAYGFISVSLVLYLVEIGFDGAEIGLLLALTFLGDAALTLWLATQADRRGRRSTLAIAGVLMALGAAGLASTDSFPILLLAATVGVISPSGAEVGPFLAVEQACLAQAVEDSKRTAVFAWYHIVGFTCSGLGALTGGWTVDALSTVAGWPLPEAYSLVLTAYAAAGGILALVARRLSSGIEASTLSAPGGMLGLRASRGRVARLSGLFLLDAFGGGFIQQSVLAWWFRIHFGVSGGDLGWVFFATNLLSGLSTLAAVPLARRIGLVNTMVWTHVPSNVLLLLVPLAPTFGIAAVILLARHTLSQMDVPTRQSYVNAIVPPDERSAANGITGFARQLGVALAALAVGPLVASGSWPAGPFVIAGGVKIAYDLLLWGAFRHLRPPEERSR